MDWFSYGNLKATTTLSLNIEVSRISSHHLIGNEACFGFDQQYCRSHQNETSKWDWTNKQWQENQQNSITQDLTKKQRLWSNTNGSLSNKDVDPESVCNSLTVCWAKPPSRSLEAVCWGNFQSLSRWVPRKVMKSGFNWHQKMVPSGKLT